MKQIVPLAFSAPDLILAKPFFFPRLIKVKTKTVRTCLFVYKIFEFCLGA